MFHTQQQNQKNQISWRIVAFVITGLVIVLGGIALFVEREAPSSPIVHIDPGEVSVKQSTASWAEGIFTPLAGDDIRARLDQYLMLEFLAEFPLGAEEAFRDKLVVFLEAFSDTHFEKYVEFRPPETVCPLDDPRIKPMLDAWSPELGPMPSNSAQIVSGAWRMYVEEGMGPVKPGAIIDAVNWSHCRARVDSLTARKIVKIEWDEMAPGESHLAKEFISATDDQELFVVMRPAVPNVISPVQIADRDGFLVYCDFDIACRAQGLEPRRLILRFVWDDAEKTWLPLHALAIGGSPHKPFFW